MVGRGGLRRPGFDLSCSAIGEEDDLRKSLILCTDASGVVLSQYDDQHPEVHENRQTSKQNRTLLRSDRKGITCSCIGNTAFYCYLHSHNRPFRTMDAQFEGPLLVVN